MRENAFGMTQSLFGIKCAHHKNTNRELYFTILKTDVKKLWGKYGRIFLAEKAVEN